MKYPVLSCPDCGCGDAEEAANGKGLIISFHPQDESHPKLPGTIFYIRCNGCGYMGPLILCDHGLSEKKIILAWNEHINPGSTLNTPDLVRELEKRGIETLDVPVDLEYRISCRKTCHCDECAQSDVKGPAKIIIIPGVE